MAGVETAAASNALKSGRLDCAAAERISNAQTGANRDPTVCGPLASDAASFIITRAPRRRNPAHAHEPARNAARVWPDLSPPKTMLHTAPITDANPTVLEMEARVARFRHLKPTDDYVDSALPGCERATLRVLGQQPDAPLAAEGFHMSIVCCDPGKSAPLHNHLTQEVFVVLTGSWEIFWGPRGERRLTLGPWDTMSIPPGVSRGFRNVSGEPAYLIGMASGADPGMINWPDHVKAAARAVGIALP
jgi:uncharacterized RmlC-like cupin family protein